MKSSNITITKKTGITVSLGFLFAALIFTYNIASKVTFVEAQVESNRTNVESVLQKVEALDKSLTETNQNAIRLTTLLEEFSKDLEALR